MPQSFPNVSGVHDQIKALVAKYNGHITSDSFNSYSYPTPTLPSVQNQAPTPLTVSQDNASIVATFDKSQNDFLTDLSNTVKNAGGMNTNYGYTDGSQPQNGGYSAYTSCVNMIQSVQADFLQLKIFVRTLEKEHDPASISLLSQSISITKGTLQNDVNTVNSFFASSDKPSVSISLNTLQR